MIIITEAIFRGGDGGNGIVSFRHEKYISRGGPDGGDGGYGGSLFLKASCKVRDLSLIKQRKGFVAESGSYGDSCRKHGRKGKDLTILVPVGTVVLVKDNGVERLIADLTTEDEEVLVVIGGRGGLGNARFTTAINQAPEICTKGEAGEEKHLILKLKLLTDICIVGLPNSGKSTLLQAISQARPRIASYPFSTRDPVLGAIQNDRNDFIVAEIPALVKGSHLGKGLGNDFLCHVERTRVIIYLLDGASSSILEDLDTLNKELILYNSDLLCKPRIIAVNKADLPEAQLRLHEIKQSLSGTDSPIFYISAASGFGISELTTKAMEMLEGMSKVKEAALSHGPRQIKNEVDEGHLTSPAIFRPKPRQAKQ